MNSVHSLPVQSSRFDATVALRLLNDAERAFDANARVVIIDFSTVQFIDSLGISTLVKIIKSAPEGIKVVLASLGPYAMKVVRITHLHEVVDVFSTVDAAVEALAA
jgi:anti-anti-sigma factor